MNPAGKHIATGRGYKSFEPAHFPLKLDLSVQTYRLLERAGTALGTLNALDRVVPNATLLIRPYALKEALLSSQIEGTQSTLSEVMAEQKETSANVNIREVRNYEKALNFGVANLDDPKGLPLSLRLLKEMHRILMTDVRGGESLKTPGEFRRSQNWIGGENIQSAFFIPCSPETLDDHLANFEKAVHEDDLPVLIKAALLHYQFETIHPFNDGNGRIGRLLVTLYLIDKKLLNKPLLYLSLYFKAYKNQYYDILTHVRETGDYERWLTFFLKGVLQVSASIEKTTRQILSLKDGLKHTVKDTYNLIDFLFETPFVDADIIKKHAGISQGTCYKLIDSFEKQGILRQVSVGKRNRRYCFQSYIDLLSSAELGDEDY